MLLSTFMRNEMLIHKLFFCFFFNDTATTEIYTLSLHDALPIYSQLRQPARSEGQGRPRATAGNRSEEHTSELQSRENLVCRLLLENKNRIIGGLLRENHSCANDHSKES